MQPETEKKEAANFWFFCTSLSNDSVMSKILSSLYKQKLISEKWKPSSDLRLGLVFINGIVDYENLISFLQFHIKAQGQRVCVLNIGTDVLNADCKIRILKYGAEYVYERDFFIGTIDTLVDRLNRWVTIERLLNSPVITKRMVGKSIAAICMLRQVIEAALYSQNNILILGERGVGKEQIANIIHELDSRKEKGDFIILDCTTLKKELSGSELFGHERGSFTGADYARDGAVALANKGSFFLDEITELPVNLQAEFLRVVQEGSYKKVGSNIWRQSQFRLIAATNRNIQLSVDRGEFRSDLLDRIATTVIEIPGLNERKEDIPLIIDFYLKKIFNSQLPTIETEVYEVLCNRNYAGNIRELKNEVHNICMRYSGNGPITLGDLSKASLDLPLLDDETKWYEKTELIQLINQAIDEGYELKKIEEAIQSIATRITLQRVGKNKDASRILGKSERWIQLQKIKERNG